MSKDDDDKKDPEMPEVPPHIAKLLESILPGISDKLGQEGKVTVIAGNTGDFGNLADLITGRSAAISAGKVKALADQIYNVWDAQCCMNNMAELYAACVLQTKLLKMDGEKKGAQEAIEQAEELAEKLFQELTKNPNPQDENVH